jgi:hypothetical protein
VSKAPRFAEALRRLQAARLAEAEALGELASALADPTGDAPSPSPPLLDSIGDAEPCYLSVRQLAARIPYAEQTIRNLMHSGELSEGTHYFKRRGRVIFSWPAMRAWVEAQSAAAPSIPLVRNNRHGAAQ